MPVRQGNQRETSGQKGTDYSDAVIEFVEHKGYFLEARAEDSGEPEDLVFSPKAGNRAKVVAEAKYRAPNKDGFSPNDYVEDFATRFYQWEEGAYEGYDFYLFASKSSNISLWNDLFKHLKDDVIESFFGKMEAQTEGMYHDFLQQHEPSRFKRFLENSYIYVDYEIEDLQRINTRAEESGEYEYNPYTINYQPVEESGRHKTNLLEVVKLPPKLYKVPVADSVTANAFYARESTDVLPVTYHNDAIYSLIHPDEFNDEMAGMVEPGSFKTSAFPDFASNNPDETELNISKSLIRGLVTMIADRNGAVVDTSRRSTRLFIQHKGRDLKRLKKWVTKGLETGEVRHRSVHIHVKFFDSQYFVCLYPTVEYTSDGEKLVSSSRKKHLVDRFPPGRHPQNHRKSQTVEIWISELSLQQSFTRFNLPDNLTDILMERVENIVLEGMRPPKSGDERNELVENQLTNSPTSGGSE